MTNKREDELLSLVAKAFDQIQNCREQISALARQRAAFVGELRNLCGATEAARMLGISRGQVYELIRDNGVASSIRT